MASRATTLLLARSGALRSVRLSAAAGARSAMRMPTATPARVFTASALVRAANPQAGGPTSKDAKHALQNAKEEVAGVTRAVASAISGGAAGGDRAAEGSGAPSHDSHSGGSVSDLLSDAKGVTAELAKKVPEPALVWGAAGLIPYVSTAAASVYLARQAGQVASGIETGMDLDTAQALLLHAQNLQLTYGAVILSFLGALHWGFEFSKYGGRLGNRRYAMGVFPVVFAWPSLLLTPQLGLIMQWATYVGIWFIDLRATNRGWVPSWYSTYRFWLTAVVGTSIIATLAGTNYYTSEGNRVSTLEKNIKRDAKQKIELQHRSAKGDKGGVITEIKGIDSEVVSDTEGEEGDAYVRVHNPKKEEEERKKKEEEQRKKEQEQSEKKGKQDNQAEEKGQQKKDGDE